MGKAQRETTSKPCAGRKRGKEAREGSAGRKRGKKDVDMMAKQVRRGRINAVRCKWVDAVKHKRIDAG
jgi:hypothetical protein